MSKYPCLYRGMIATHLGGLVHRCHHPSTATYCVLEGESRHAICADCLHREQEERDQHKLIKQGNWKFIRTSQLVEDCLRLAAYVPANCKGIIGVARSGLIPASVIAAHLHLPLYSIDKDHGLVSIGAGCRAWSGSNYGAQDGIYFVLDDSVHDGNTMWLIKSLMPTNDFMSAAVYVNPKAANSVDVFVAELPPPHLFEWNLFNNGLIKDWTDVDESYTGIAIDFDGVLCEDPPPTADGRNADSADDLNWLINAKPSAYLPRGYPVRMIITNRLEKWRAETEEWLRRHGVRWIDLIMSPYETTEERDANFPQEVVRHKGQRFVESGCFMYVESDPSQAELIFEYAQKPVLCPSIGHIFQ